jgi:hypothetical protein
MLSRVPHGWEMFCPANTVPYRPKSATTATPCMVAVKPLEKKPSSGEILCRSIGAQPRLPACS